MSILSEFLLRSDLPDDNIDWEEFKLEFDYSQLEFDNSGYTCQSPFETKNWNGTDYTCPGTYTYTENKGRNLKITLGEISKFMKTFI